MIDENNVSFNEKNRDFGILDKILHGENQKKLKLKDFKEEKEHNQQVLETYE